MGITKSSYTRSALYNVLNRHFQFFDGMDNIKQRVNSTMYPSLSPGS